MAAPADRDEVGVVVHDRISAAAHLAVEHMVAVQTARRAADFTARIHGHSLWNGDVDCAAIAVNNLA